MSLKLYKIGDLNCKDISSFQVVGTLVGSLIQQFKPQPLNIEQLDVPKNKTVLTDKLRHHLILTKLESPKQTSLYSKHSPEPMSERDMLVVLP